MTETENTTAKRKRRLERQTEVAASPAEVWKALTEPAEPTKWFPARSASDSGESKGRFLRPGDRRWRLKRKLWDGSRSGGWRGSRDLR
jgi:uncharacterized protein YndB with AHSA1/START domain